MREASGYPSCPGSSGVRSTESGLPDHALLATLRPYLPLVQVELARLGSYLPPDVDLETLQGRALLALLAAAQERSPHNPGFATHARLVVWRALTDSLRRSRFFLVETRRALECVEQATDQALRLGLEAQPEQVAELLTAPVEQLRESLVRIAALMAGLPRVVLGETARGRRGHWEQRLAQAICALPAAEQQVVALYYFDDLTFSEIAQALEQPVAQVEWTFGRAAVFLRLRLVGDRFESALGDN